LWEKEGGAERRKDEGDSQATSLVTPPHPSAAAPLPPSPTRGEGDFAPPPIRPPPFAMIRSLPDRPAPAQEERA